MKFVPTSVTRSAAKALLQTKKNSPKILFAAGVVSFGATVFTASKATLHLEEKLDKFEEGKNLAEKNMQLRPDYGQDKYDHDVRVYRYRMAVDIAKMYAPAIGFGALTLLCFAKAHQLQQKRIAGLSAALALTAETFEKYRERVREELGEEKDREFYHGAVEEEIQVPTANGMKTKKVKSLAGPSGYARMFDRTNVNWQPQPSSNETFLRAQQEYANKKLNAYGYVLLNDIYEALGYERTTAGCVVGWCKKNPKGEGVIDFGIGDWPSAKDFSEGTEHAVLLDFNVDGEVYRLMDIEV